MASRGQDEVGKLARNGDQPVGGANAKPGTGSYSATSLTPSASWEVSAQTGDFTWSYPLRVPPAPGGLQPELGLSYSSGTVDGLTSTTNNQASWVGDGWNMWPGYIERSYAACAESMPGSERDKPGDLCWKNDNATMSFNGSGSKLIKDDTTKVWRPRSDDGSRVERFDGVDNGDHEKQYWRVTKPDGTQYFFGSRPEAKSTWTVPVFGKNKGEACNGATFDTSWCNRAYRWNLDKVVDRFGNMLTYQYETETNSYGRNKSSAAASYIRGGWLARADYGLRSDQNVPAVGSVVFETTDRCVPGSECKLEKPQNLPDVPLGLKCDDAKCKDKWSPTFWSTKRLDKIITKVRRGTELTDVDSWTLKHELPDPGDGERAALWLRSIIHTGHVGGAPISLPEVTFEGVRKPNRASTDSGNAALIRFRMNAIVSESGGVTSIKYRDPDCVGSTMPAKPEFNTLLCYPVRWSAPGGTERTDYFHKYVVESVSNHDQISSSVADVVSYEYHDGAAWHGDESDIVTDVKKTWTDFRGFGRVTIRKGSGHDGPKTKTQQVFYRGMHGDKLPSGKREASVTDSEKGKENDEDWLNGVLREQLVFDGDTDRVVSKTITEPVWQGPTAARGELKAYIVRPGVVRAYTALEAGGWRATRTETDYDDRGLAKQVNDLGDIGTATDDRCARTTYARNTDTWLLTLPVRVESVSVHCGATPVFPGHSLSDVRSSYDGRNPGEPPIRGTLTKVEVAGERPAVGPDYVTVSTATYDTYGRPLKTTDALNRASTLAYLPESGGPVTQSTTTNALGHTTATTLEPAWGQPLKVVDANRRVTEMTYDALGRTTEVWSPMRARTKGRGSAYYSYEVRRDGPNVVTTTSLGPNGNYTSSNILYDGLLRTRQSQAPAVGGGRLISDVRYDSQGRAVRKTQPYFNEAAVDNNLWRAADADIPGTIVTQYDGAGRQIAQTFNGGGTPKWTTVSQYGGDRVHVTPPAGGTPTTTITDSRGQTVELRQYKGSTPTGEFDRTRYSYTAAGRPESMIDPAGNTWRFGHDLRGRQVRIDDPDKGESTMTYDNADQLTSMTDARGVTLVHSYDDLGRRTKTEHRKQDNTSVTLAERTYDTAIGGRGLLATSTRFASGKAYTMKVEAYDGLGNKVSWDWIIPGAETGLAGTYNSAASYNQNGSQRAVVYAKAGTLAAETYNFGYDDVGRPLTTYANQVNIVTDTQYTRYGEKQRVQLGDGGKRTWLSSYFDDHSRRLKRTIIDAEVPQPMQADLNYTHDDSGNITTIADQSGSQFVDAQCFSYDHLQRLTRAWTTPVGCATAPDAKTLGGVAPYWLSYTYDPAGNRLTDTRHAPEGETVRRYTYPAPGQPKPHLLRSVHTEGSQGQRLDEFNYDQIGNTTGRKLANGTQHILDWDAEGRLAKNTEGANVTEAVYDPDGTRLIRRDPGGSTLYLPGQEVRFDKASGRTTVTRYYTHAGQSVAMRVDQALIWLAQDHQGTAQFAVNSETLNAVRRRQTPFGEPRGPKVAFPGEKGFVGGTIDASTELIHIGAREYDPTIGRFISVDPILNPADPQQWNGYNYANNSPITKSDPTGLEPLMEWCKNATTPDCANHYYGGKVHDPTLNTAAAEGCKWDRHCINQQGSRANKNHSPNFKPNPGSLMRGFRPVLIMAAVVLTDVVVFAGCTAITGPLTAGVSTVACAGAAGAAGGTVSGALNGGNVGEEAATGAVIGAATGGLATGIRSLSQRGAGAGERAAAQEAATVAHPSGYSVKDVDRVRDHLSNPVLDPFEANDIMMERIRNALTEGKTLTEAQANFMRHETTELALMNQGRCYTCAHKEAMKTHPVGKNYDLDLIDRFESFGPYIRKMNGLPPR
ncbi:MULTISPECIES: RHS repeat-associated core domain-containing protein [unclassified Crossiella]|uniref:RHS repeat-associated core domain-containing protein n=1 Tax=unclassified Crossiella TaxID=2620835 RepID=UPI001FFF04F8|nr:MULTISPECIES: RHS repeat-associated core domain-containing protein [unclassified Crossiella]MCK2238989.1 type IV secretion protein Rhs [Crossiella sp. S99.2]MCK2251442.1 type IV secretion protein Rhs [Crossiella sp. S99.1]